MIFECPQPTFKYKNWSFPRPCKKRVKKVIPRVYLLQFLMLSLDDGSTRKKNLRTSLDFSYFQQSIWVIWKIQGSIWSRKIWIFRGRLQLARNWAVYRTSFCDDFIIFAAKNTFRKILLTPLDFSYSQLSIYVILKIPRSIFKWENSDFPRSVPLSRNWAEHRPREIRVFSLENWP